MGDSLIPGRSDPTVSRLEVVGTHESEGMPLAAILWHRKGLVIIGMIAGLVVAFFYQLRSQPIYQVSAQMMVVRKKVDAGIDMRTSVVDDYVATQLAVIKGDQVLREAAMILQEESPEAAPTESVDDARVPVAPQATLATMEPGRVLDFLKAGLTVTKDAQSASSNIVVLTFKSDAPRDCSLALRAIVRGYKAFLDKMYNLANDAYMTRLDRTISTVRRDASVLREELRAIETRIQQSSVDGVLSRQVALLETVRNYQSSLDRLRIRREDLVDQARVAGLMSRTDLPGGSGVDEILGRDVNLSRLQEIRLLERKVRMLNRQGLGKDHPDVKDLVDEIRELKTNLPALPADGAARKTEPASDEPMFGSRSDALVSHIETKIDELDMKLAEAKSSLAELQPQIDEMRQAELRKADLTRKLEKADRDVELHEQIRQQYMMTKDHGGYDAQEITRIPDTGTEIPRRGTLILLVGLFFGGALGSGLAWLAEKTDRTFRDPGEVQRVLGVSVLGSIPVLDVAEEPDPAALLDSSLIVHHAPKSQEAEAYRGLRTALYFSTRGSGHQVIQITSPSAGDGKSTLSANLAICMAQSGRKVLLIDADMRKPRIHKLIKIENNANGLAAVIEGKVPLAEAVRPAGIINLSVLCCGGRPANPAELLTSPNFPVIIEETRKLYDVVIIDTPPLLAVSDPCVVAARVDGVILTLRLRKNGRPLAERARDILSALDAKVLGVVLNGNDKDSARKDGYSYYGYQYGSSYSYTDYHHYTDEEGRQSPSPASRVLPMLGLRGRKGPPTQ